MSATVTGTAIVILLITVVLDILVMRNLICLLIALIIWCKKRKKSRKWDPRSPLVGLYMKNKLKFYRKKQALLDENGFIDGDRGSMADVEKQEGKDVSNFQYDDTDAERHDKLREEAEARRQALIHKMRSTVGSNGFTEASRPNRRHRMLNDQDEMGDLDRPAFQRNLTKDEIDRLIAENPELEEELENERHKWLEFGQEDEDNINPLSDYNTLLVAKMQKGYDGKGEDKIDRININNFRTKKFAKELEKIEEERQNEMKELEMDHLEATGKAVVLPGKGINGRPIRKKIKRKKKGKKKGKMFILDTPYGKAKYYKRRRSPPSISEETGVMFQSHKNLDKKTRSKANRLHGIDEQDELNKSDNNSSVVEGNEVIFETGFGPNKKIDSDSDDIEEGDMVFYNKDDMTNFSKNLGLNKLKSRLSFMSKKSKGRRTAEGFGDDLDPDEEAHSHMGHSMSQSPRRKFVQKKTDRKRKKKKGKKKTTRSISSIGSFKKRRTISIRDAVSSIRSDSRQGDFDDYTSEEDNPNDRSGLLSNYANQKSYRKNNSRSPKKRNNKWISNKKHNLNDTMSSGRKSFRSTNNLSLILPRYKKKLKRHNVIRKKAPKKVLTSTGSPYEEYLPKRFREYKNEDPRMSKDSNKLHIDDSKLMDMQKRYGSRQSRYDKGNLDVSQTIPKNSASDHKKMNFYADKNDTVRKSHRKMKSSINNFGKILGLEYHIDLGSDIEVLNAGVLQNEE